MCYQFVLPKIIKRHRAGGHPTPYVSIGTHGDFERVLGCQVNESETTLIAAEHLLGPASQSLFAEAIAQTKIELNFACLFPEDRVINDANHGEPK